MDKAIVLLSGGLDSATMLALVKTDGWSPHALSFHYGQRHAIELQTATQMAQAAGIAHLVVKVDPAIFGRTTLTGSGDVPKDQLSDQPATYVPARNTIFLSLALAHAEAVGARDIFLGANALDYSGYPDCRPEYIEAYETMANLATRAKNRLTIHTPLIAMSKADIIRRGLELEVDYALTSSCYDPDLAGRPCGHCDSCLLRLKAFAEVGAADPLRYQ